MSKKIRHLTFSLLTLTLSAFVFFGLGCSKIDSNDRDPNNNLLVDTVFFDGYSSNLFYLFTYDALKRVKYMEFRNDGSGGLNQNDYKIIYTYAGNSNQVTQRELYTNTSQLPNSTTYYKYDANGRKIFDSFKLRTSVDYRTKRFSYPNDRLIVVNQVIKNGSLIILTDSLFLNELSQIDSIRYYYNTTVAGQTSPFLSHSDRILKVDTVRNPLYYLSNRDAEFYHLDNLVDYPSILFNGLNFATKYFTSHCQLAVGIFDPEGKQFYGRTSLMNAYKLPYAYAFDERNVYSPNYPIYYRSYRFCYRL